MPTPTASTENDIQSVVESIAAQLHREKSVRVSLREMCAMTPQRTRVTLNWRRELQAALADANLKSSSLLIDAGLDEPIEISRRSWVLEGWRSIQPRAITLGRLLVAVIGLAAAILALRAHFFDGKESEKMSGDVNIMAAPFYSPQNAFDGRATADSLSHLLRASLPKARGALSPSIEVRGPGGVAPPETKEEASALAVENGAQILIYGTIRRRGVSWAAIPQLYIAANWLTGAEELGGAFSLDPIEIGAKPIETSIAGHALIRQEIVDDARGLANFAVGLGWFQAAKWRKAIGWFDRTSSPEESVRLRGMALLFKGNASGKLGRFSAAHDAYVNALEANPRLTRARLGLTEIELHRTLGHCTYDIDPNGVRAAIRRFRILNTQAATERPTVRRALRLRTRLGEARGELCLAQAGGGTEWLAAIRDLRAVLSLGKRFKLQFSSELAEAHAGLGLAYLPRGPLAVGAGEAYHRAAEQYKRAEALASGTAERRAFAQMLAFIETRLGQIKWDQETSLAATG